MLYSLRGKLVHHDGGSVAVECGGVAYLCQTSMSTLGKLAKIGAEVTLYTYMSIRQDAIDLFGFADMAELSCFKMLTSVTGVGPKAALSILSCMTPERLALCVAAGDFKSITAAPGIGNKLAQRIVLELQDKVKGADMTAGAVSGGMAQNGAISGAVAEAISALVVLGFAQVDAAAAIAKLDADTPVEDMIKAGLRALAGR